MIFTGGPIPIAKFELHIFILTLFFTAAVGFVFGHNGWGGRSMPLIPAGLNIISSVLLFLSLSAGTATQSDKGFSTSGPLPGEKFWFYVVLKHPSWVEPGLGVLCGSFAWLAIAVTQTR